VISTILAFTPFLQPLAIDRYWLLLAMPLVVAVATVYKTLKLDDLSQLPWQVVRLTGMIVAFMVLAAAALWLVSEWV
jgi:hypothetical protein